MIRLRGIDGKLDDICAQLCKERADWTCERCGKVFPERKGFGLHWSHFFGRRHRRTRWSMVNCAAHCAGCHDFLGDNPILFGSWIREYLGEDESYGNLIDAHNSIWKPIKSEKQEMLAHYEAELTRLRQMRTDGVKGYIRVADWF